MMDDTWHDHDAPRPAGSFSPFELFEDYATNQLPLVVNRVNAALNSRTHFLDDGAFKQKSTDHDVFR